MSSSSSPPISLNVTYKTEHYILSLLPSETFASLQARLEELTSVPRPFQKLLYKGKKIQINGEVTIEEAGLKNGTKVMLLGSTQDEVGGVMVAEAEKRRKDDIMRQREARGPTKAIISQSPRINLHAKALLGLANVRSAPQAPLPKHLSISNFIDLSLYLIYHLQNLHLHY